jgi:hypothetical protein
VLRQRGHVAIDRFQRRVVGVGARHLEQLGRVAQLALQALHAPDDVLQQLFFAAELLRALLVFPDPGVLELAPDFA